ncbi:hypothetical protein [Bacillus cereus]|nr:hypothetical protein [Bacillus cereus]
MSRNHKANTGKQSFLVVISTGGEGIVPNDPYFHYLGISSDVQENID